MSTAKAMIAPAAAAIVSLRSGANAALGRRSSTTFCTAGDKLHACNAAARCAQRHRTAMINPTSMMPKPTAKFHAPSSAITGTCGDVPLEVM